MPADPHYTIRYLDHDGVWKDSKWKMTIAYAVKQYAGLEWDPIMESEEYCSDENTPVFHGNSAARFQRGQ